MRHLPILSEPHGERSLKSSRQLELYKLGCRVSGGVQPQEMAPVLLAEYGVEERKGGTGGRGGAHPVRLSELPMKFLPNRLFAPAPIKRKVDGGESDEGHVGNRERESADGRDDESGCAGPRALKNMIGDLRLVKAIPNEGCGCTIPRRCPRTRVLNDSSHPAASDNGEGVSNLWLRDYSSDKESIRFFKDHPDRQRATLVFSRDENAAPYHGAHTNRKRGNSFLADRETSGEANH